LNNIIFFLHGVISFVQKEAGIPITPGPYEVKSVFVTAWGKTPHRFEMP